MAYELSEIRLSQQIFYYLLEHFELWEEEELRRKHVRSPSEIGILYVLECNCIAMLENSIESDSLDKKTVIVMVGLPV